MPSTAAATPTVLYRTVLKPNRSLGRGGQRIAVTLVAGVLGVSSCAFIAAGAWPVTGFLGLDVVALYVALRLSRRRDDIREEIISITEREVKIHRTDRRGRRAEWSVAPYWLRVGMPSEDGPVTLTSHGRQIAVGSFLAPRERRELADTLRRVLAPLSGMPEMRAARPRPVPDAPCAPAPV